MASACRTAAAATVALFCAATLSGQSQPPAPPGATAQPNADSVKKAEQVLAEARKALGGEKLTGLKSLTATGRTKRVRGNNLVPIEFELFVELPDKYVRVDEFPAEDTDPTSSGFNGDALIQLPPPPATPAPGQRGTPPGAPGAVAGGPAGMPAGPPGAARPGAPPPGATPPAANPPPAAPPAAAPPVSSPGTTPPATATGAPAAGATPPSAMPGAMAPGGRGPMGPPMDPRRARIATVKQDFARLALGLFAASPASPLTYSYAAIAEAPQGKADVLDVKGEGNFTLRYFINSDTHLPIMVSWTTPPTNVIVTVPGQPPPSTVAPGAVVVAGPPAPAAGAPKEEMDKYTKDVLAIRAKAQATPVEHRLYFADYRDVDGLRFPFRLRRAIGTETTEETTFDRFRVNAKIDPRKFDAVK